MDTFYRDKLSIKGESVEAILAVQPKKFRPVISNAVFGMSLFVFTEVMFFMALISAFLVIQKDRGATWDLPESIVLPHLVTGINTFILMMSGAALWWAGKKWSDQVTASKWFLRSALLGTTFVFIQGSEWLQLLEHGFSVRASIFGACFFLLVGMHALHALIGAGVLAYGWWQTKNNRLSFETLQALQIFWFFIVGVWPILYFVVYF